MKCLDGRSGFHIRKDDEIKMVSASSCTHFLEEVKYEPGKYLKQGPDKPLLLIELFE